MSKIRDDMDWIEDFLEGSLDVSEEAEFQSRLASDPSFKEKYRQRLNLQGAWRSAEHYRQVSRRVGEIISQERSSGHRRRNFMLLAASLLVLLAVGTALLLVMPEKSLQEQNLANVPSDSSAQPGQGPQAIGIPAYAASDTFNKAVEGKAVLVSPADKAVFFQGDTIHLQWDPAVENSRLTIRKKSNDSLIFIIDLPEDRTDFLLGTGEFLPGTYTWAILGSENLREFTIRKPGK